MKFTSKEYYLALAMYYVYIKHLRVIEIVPFNEITNLEQESWIMVVREKINVKE
jgi:hypothetical protein